MKSMILAAALAALNVAQPYAAVVDPRPAIEMNDELEVRILRLTERLEKIKAKLDKKRDTDG